MFGLMTKAEHERLMEAERASSDRWYGEAVAAHDLAMRNHAKVDELCKQIAANARYVEVGKARLATLERAKAKREGV